MFASKLFHNATCSTLQCTLGQVSDTYVTAAGLSWRVAENTFISDYDDNPSGTSREMTSSKSTLQDCLAWCKANITGNGGCEHSSILSTNNCWVKTATLETSTNHVYYEPTNSEHWDFYVPSTSSSSYNKSKYALTCHNGNHTPIRSHEFVMIVDGVESGSGGSPSAPTPSSAPAPAPAKVPSTTALLTQNQSDCYWTNFPLDALKYQQINVALDRQTATYDYTIHKNQGEIRPINNCGFIILL